MTVFRVLECVVISFLIWSKCPHLQLIMILLFDIHGYELIFFFKRIPLNCISYTSHKTRLAHRQDHAQAGTDQVGQNQKVHMMMHPSKGRKETQRARLAYAEGSCP